MKLATVREDGEPTRRRAFRSEFSEAEWRLVSELADHPNRLLVTATTETGETYAEVAHEAIFRRWNKLKEWIAAEREFLVWRHRLEAARRIWEAQENSERMDGALLMGTALSQAHDWLRQRPDDLPSDDKLFIARSLEREEAKRLQARALRDQALSMQSRFLADSASRTNNYWIAVALALAALPDERCGVERPYVPVAELALYRGLVNLSAELSRKWKDKPKVYTSLWQHQSQINSVAFSPDGRFAITGSGDETAKIWNTQQGECIVTLNYKSSVGSASFSPDGAHVIIGLEDSTARLCCTDGTEVAVFQGHSDAINTACFSPNGQVVLTASRDRTSRLWDTGTSACITVLEEEEGVASAQFSPDGQRILTASGQCAQIWSAHGANRLKKLRGHSQIVTAASFSPDQNFAATGSGDLTVRIWDAETGETLKTLGGRGAGRGPINIDGTVMSVSFSPDGRRLLTASGDTKAIVWDIAGATPIASVRGGIATFSPDGTRLLTAHRWDDACSIGRIWPIFATTQELVNYARTLDLFELTSEQRAQFFLS